MVYCHILFLIPQFSSHKGKIFLPNISDFGLNNIKCHFIIENKKLSSLQIVKYLLYQFVICTIFQIATEIGTQYQCALCSSLFFYPIFNYLTFAIKPPFPTVLPQNKKSLSSIPILSKLSKYYKTCMCTSTKCTYSQDDWPYTSTYQLVMRQWAFLH